MKSRFSCLLVAIMLAAPVASIFTTGCGSTGSSSALKIATETEAATLKTVDGAMSGWRDWVNAGKASTNQVVQVQSAYQKYYDGQIVVKAALERWATSGTPTSAEYDASKASENAAKDSLISLVNAFTTKAP